MCQVWVCVMVRQRVAHPMVRKEAIMVRSKPPEAQQARKGVIETKEPEMSGNMVDTFNIVGEI